MLTDADMRATYETDWLRQWHGTTPVRRAARHRWRKWRRCCGVCAAAGVAVVPQGGNTGLVGGSVPRGGAVLLSLQRLRPRSARSTRCAMQVTAGAGVTIEQLQLHARAAGLDFAVDWGARADRHRRRGGQHQRRRVAGRALRHHARAGDGRCRRCSPTARSSPSWRACRRRPPGRTCPACWWAARARWPWSPPRGCGWCRGTAQTAAALIACDSLVDAVSLLPRCVSCRQPRRGRVADARGAARRVRATSASTPPLDPASAGAFVMVDCAAHDDPTDELAALLGDERGVLAVGAQRDLLYRIRDHITIAIGALGVPLKLDVAVPVAAPRSAGRAACSAAVARRGAELIVFGHLAEGNLHVNVLGAGERAADVTRARAAPRRSTSAAPSAPSTASAWPRPTGSSA